MSLLRSIEDCFAKLCYKDAGPVPQKDSQNKACRFQSLGPWGAATRPQMNTKAPKNLTKTARATRDEVSAWHQASKETLHQSPHESIEFLAIATAITCAACLARGTHALP